MCKRSMQTLIRKMIQAVFPGCQSMVCDRADPPDAYLYS
jgi:hypothetical protein